MVKWKTINRVSIVNPDGDSEIVEIKKSDNFYRIQNEFGNVFFEFDSNSGIKFAEELFSIIYSEIFSEVTTLLEEEKGKHYSKIKNYSFKKNIKKQKVV